MCLRALSIWPQDPINRRSSALGTNATSLSILHPRKLIQNNTRPKTPWPPTMDRKAQSKPSIWPGADPYDLYKSDLVRPPVSASRPTQDSHQTITIPTKSLHLSNGFFLNHKTRSRRTKLVLQTNTNPSKHSVPIQRPYEGVASLSHVTLLTLFQTHHSRSFIHTPNTNLASPPNTPPQPPPPPPNTPASK